VAPCSTAHSFIADATASATELSERLTVRHRAAQRVVNRFGKARLLNFVAEHETAERLGGARGPRLLCFRDRPIAD
jgi:hypothetical protein